MGSRLLYGMSDQRLLPASLTKVHARTGVPYNAVLAMLAVGALLVLVGDLEALLGATSFLLLLVFTTVNIALIVLRCRDREKTRGFQVPLMVPALGGIVSTTLAVFAPPESLPLVAGLVLCGLILVGVHWSIPAKAATGKSRNLRPSDHRSDDLR